MVRKTDIRSFPGVSDRVVDYQGLMMMPVIIAMTYANMVFSLLTHPVGCGAMVNDN